MSLYHAPVLLKESIEGLSIQSSGIYVDATYGGGGHSGEILKHLKEGKLFAFDQDEDAMANDSGSENLKLINANFRFFRNFLRYYNVEFIDGILADLGVSSHHFDTAERGFSFRSDAELDMRMNRGQKFTAATLLNTYNEKQLQDVFSNFGEVENSRKLALTIVQQRATSELKTINNFLECIRPCIPASSENKYLAKVFQALRIEVNGEVDALKELLLSSVKSLKAGGRLVIITYHSLEDKIVKNFMRHGNFEGESQKDFYGNAIVPFKPVNKKVIVPTEKEISTNNRARSAKLRIAEKI